MCAGWLAFGVALGWAAKRLQGNEVKANKRADVAYRKIMRARHAAMWGEHVEAHAREQARSVAMTAPDALPTLDLHGEV